MKINKIVITKMKNCKYEYKVEFNGIILEFSNVDDMLYNISNLMTKTDINTEEKYNNKMLEICEIICDFEADNDTRLDIYKKIEELVSHNNARKGVFILDNRSFAFSIVDYCTIFVHNLDHTKGMVVDPDSDDFDRWMKEMYMQYNHKKRIESASIQVDPSVPRIRSDTSLTEINNRMCNSATVVTDRLIDIERIVIEDETYDIEYGSELQNAHTKYFYKFTEKVKTPEFIERYKTTKRTEKSMGGTLEDDDNTLRYWMIDFRLHRVDIY